MMTVGELMRARRSGPVHVASARVWASTPARGVGRSLIRSTSSSTRSGRRSSKPSADGCTPRSAEVVRHCLRGQAGGHHRIQRSGFRQEPRWSRRSSAAQHEPLDQQRMSQREFLGDHAAHRQARDHRRLCPDESDHVGHIIGHLGDREGCRRHPRISACAVVDANHVGFRLELLDERVRPYQARRSPPVEQHDQRLRTVHDVGSMPEHLRHSSASRGPSAVRADVAVRLPLESCVDSGSGDPSLMRTRCSYASEFTAQESLVADGRANRAGAARDCEGVARSTARIAS